MIFVSNYNRIRSRKPALRIYSSSQEMAWKWSEAQEGSRIAHWKFGQHWLTANRTECRKEIKYLSFAMAEQPDTALGFIDVHGWHMCFRRIFANQNDWTSGTLATFDIDRRTFDIGILRYWVDIERLKMTFDIEIRYQIRYRMFCNSISNALNLENIDIECRNIRYRCTKISKNIRYRSIKIDIDSARQYCDDIEEISISKF